MQRKQTPDRHRALANLEGDDELVSQAAQAWLEAFIHSTPGGKQTTTAARTMPEPLLGTVRTRGAWNLANAFMCPVTGTDLLGTSSQRLFSHFQSLRGFYGNSELRTVAGAALSCDTEPLPAEDTRHRPERVHHPAADQRARTTSMERHSTVRCLCR